MTRSPMPWGRGTAVWTTPCLRFRADQLTTSANFAGGAKSNCSVRLRTTDAAGSSFEKSLTLIVLANPWQNPVNPCDVDGVSGVAPLDVLLLINRINTQGAEVLPRPHPAPGSPPYFDTNGDGSVTPLDALLVINYINHQIPANAEGPEGESLLDVASLGRTERALRQPLTELASAEWEQVLDGLAEAQSTVAGRGTSLGRMHTAGTFVSFPVEFVPITCDPH